MPESAESRVERRLITALWGFDKTGRYPPQFVGAVSEGLRDSWYEESERIRELAELWFTDFGNEPDDWRFEVIGQSVAVPEVCICGNDEAEDDRATVLRCPIHGPAVLHAR